MPKISRTIDDALIELGVLNPVDEASPQDHEFALRKLNMIIDSLNTQNLTISHLEDKKYEDQVMKGYIDIGIGKEWDTPAPTDIQGLFWSLDGETDYKSTPISVDKWSSIRTKNTHGIPVYHYVSRDNEDNVRIYFNRIPIGNLKLHILAKTAYTGSGENGAYTPTDDINWSRGYEKMLTYRLAMELATTYGVQPPAMLGNLADEAMNNLKTYNYKPRTLKTTLRNRNKRRHGTENLARY